MSRRCHSAIRAARGRGSPQGRGPKGPTPPGREREGERPERGYLCGRRAAWSRRGGRQRRSCGRRTWCSGRRPGRLPPPPTRPRWRRSGPARPGNAPVTAPRVTAGLQIPAGIARRCAPRERTRHAGHHGKCSPNSEWLRGRRVALREM